MITIPSHHRVPTIKVKITHQEPEMPCLPPAKKCRGDPCGRPANILEFIYFTCIMQSICKVMPAERPSIERVALRIIPFFTHPRRHLSQVLECKETIANGLVVSPDRFFKQKCSGDPCGRQVPLVKERECTWINLVKLRDGSGTCQHGGAAHLGQS
jgi:hypothetical protein